ncbi:MAG TPA: helix-turn-helix domain-containing protein [Chitinispirillaceae bacterium]|nr:helix-turn-helix domain-containing protein [Chitinispirillaceae bacterium]
MRSIADVLRDEGVKIGVGKGIKIGEEIGEKIGEKKVHSENEMRDAKMVIKMYHKGISIKDIHEITGISMQKIRKILKSD